MSAPAVLAVPARSVRRMSPDSVVVTGLLLFPGWVLLGVAANGGTAVPAVWMCAALAAAVPALYRWCFGLEGGLVRPGPILGAYLVLMTLVGTWTYLWFVRVVALPDGDLTAAVSAQLVAIAGFAFGYRLLRVRRLDRPRRTGEDEGAPRRAATLVVFAALALGAVGAYRVLGQLDLALLLTDPFASRAAVSGASPSGVSWLLFKLLYVAAVLAVLLRSRSVVGSAHRLGLLTTVAVVSISLLLFLAYGGRWLPLSLLAVLVLIRHRYGAPLRPLVVTVTAVALILVSITYSGYRYFASEGRALTRSGLESTYLRQLSGDISEIARSSALLGVGVDRNREVLLSEVRTKSLPSVLRGAAAPSSQPESFGRYVALEQGRPEAGGIRVGAVGEMFLAFGLVGAGVLGVATGATALLCDRAFRSRRRSVVVAGALLATQVVFVLIIGVANVVSSLVFVALAWAVVELVFARPPDVPEGQS